MVIGGKIAGITFAKTSEKSNKIDGNVPTAIFSLYASHELTKRNSTFDRIILSTYSLRIYSLCNP